MVQKAKLRAKGDRHGKSPAPTGASWRPWLMAMTEVVAAEVKRFAKKNPKVVVTKLVLDVDASQGDVFLAIDTSTAKGWNPDSFTHAQAAELHEHKKLARLMTMASASRAARDDFFVGSTVALLCLEGDGHLAPLTLADDFGVLLRDHHETEAMARRRLATIAARLGT